MKNNCYGVFIKQKRVSPTFLDKNLAYSWASFYYEDVGSEIKGCYDEEYDEKENSEIQQ